MVSLYCTYQLIKSRVVPLSLQITGRVHRAAFMWCKVVSLILLGIGFAFFLIYYELYLMEGGGTQTSGSLAWFVAEYGQLLANHQPIESKVVSLSLRIAQRVHRAKFMRCKSCLYCDGNVIRV